MAKFRVFGASTKEESAREREHRALARRAAAEGIVLMENDGVLPLAPKKIALYGAGARMTVKGGTGSGEVNERYSVNIDSGLKNAGFTIVSNTWLDRYDAHNARAVEEYRRTVEEKIKGYGPIRTMQMFGIIYSVPKPQPALLPIEDSDLSDETDTALYILSRQAGEGNDRKMESGDYLISDVERGSLKRLTEHYKKVILVINAGGIVDLSVLDEMKLSAVLYINQPGMEGGNALADVLTGKITPSGRLTDTWGYRYEDYPSAKTYSYLSGDLSHNDYYEGTYIGYRWFDANKIKPRYPFGYGLSYTSFTQKVENVSVEGTMVAVSVTIKNTGDTNSGKDTALVFLRKPGDGARRLVAFGKTKLLAPGETQELRLTFDISQEGLFDEANAQFVLYKGEYGLTLNDEPAAVLTLNKTVVTEQVEHICGKKLPFEDFAPNTEAIYPPELPRYELGAAAFKTMTHRYEKPTSQISAKVKSTLDRLSDHELCQLVTGGGYSMRGYINVPGVVGNTSVKLVKKGIPNITLSDGPAGLRVQQAAAVQRSGLVLYPEGLQEGWLWGYLKYVAPIVKSTRGRLVYHYMSAFPCETMQAQSFDTELMEEIGSAIGREMEEIGVAVWLAPGMNLHRNPLCGRNFEYYSEDALLTGKIAAALTRGVQSHKGCFVAIKHFCCNNQEDNRDHMSSELSEKTLRELYLRGFRIAVEEATPGTVMSSYNMVNGVYTPNSYDLCTKVLRNEWGFKGLVMSDWESTDKCSHPAAINVGNDLIMPGRKDITKTLLAALKTGELEHESLKASAARVLDLIFTSHTSEGF